MKKISKKIFGMVASFIIGAQTKVFALDDINVVYGPPPEPAPPEIVEPSVYGPPPDPSVSAISGGQIFSIVSAILLFIIGLFVVMNKKIKKKNKVIVVIALSIAIIALLLLALFVF